MDASMACHTGEGDSGSSKVKHVAQHVIPALPLRPVKRRPAPNKAHDAAPVENGPEHGTSERLPSGGQDTPDRALKVQFGELERDHEQAVYYSLPSFENTSSSTPSTLPSDASNNDTLTQATSSRTSSAPPTFKNSSDNTPHTRRQTLQTSVVELPAEASISRSSSLKISFLYEEESDSHSPESTPYSESAMAHMLLQPLNPLNLPDSTPNQPLAGGNAAEAVPDLLNATENYNPANPFLPNVPARAHILPSAMIPLYLYFLTLFDDKIQSDQRIMVHVPGAPPIDCYFDAHKIVISRSPTLALLLHPNAVSGIENGSITLFWPSQYFNQNAFMHALRYLYSEIVLSIDEIEAMTYLGVNQHISQWRGSQIIYTIAYWLGGLILQADAVVHQAEAIVSGLINFDIIETALTASMNLRNHDLLVDEGDQAAIQRQNMYEIARKLGAKLQEILFGFIARNITFKDFELDPTLDQTLVQSRFPITQGLVDRYLQQLPVQTIQFGQFPPQQAPPPARQLSMSNMCTSFIMLNIPFATLKEAVPIMREVAKKCSKEDVWVKDFFKKVIAEREARRDIANTDPSVSDEEQLANMDVWRALGYEESVIEDAETGDWNLEAECSEEWSARG